MTFAISIRLAKIGHKKILQPESPNWVIIKYKWSIFRVKIAQKIAFVSKCLTLRSHNTHKDFVMDICDIEWTQWSILSGVLATVSIFTFLLALFDSSQLVADNVSLLFFVCHFLCLFAPNLVNCINFSSNSASSCASSSAISYLTSYLSYVIIM